MYGFDVRPLIVAALIAGGLLFKGCSCACDYVGDHVNVEWR